MRSEGFLLGVLLCGALFAVVLIVRAVLRWVDKIEDGVRLANRLGEKWAIYGQPNIDDLMSRVARLEGIASKANKGGKDATR